MGPAPVRRVPAHGVAANSATVRAEADWPSPRPASVPRKPALRRSPAPALRRSGVSSDRQGDRREYGCPNQKAGELRELGLAPRPLPFTLWSRVPTLHPSRNGTRPLGPSSGSAGVPPDLPRFRVAWTPSTTLERRTTHKHAGRPTPAPESGGLAPIGAEKSALTGSERGFQGLRAAACSFSRILQPVTHPPGSVSRETRLQVNLARRSTPPAGKASGSLLGSGRILEEPPCGVRGKLGSPALDLGPGVMNLGDVRRCYRGSGSPEYLPPLSGIRLLSRCPPRRGWFRALSS